MEPSLTKPPPVSPAYVNAQPGRTILLGGLAVIVIAALAYAGYHYWQGDRYASSDARVLLQAPGLPFVPAQVVDTRARSLTPLTVEGQGTAAIVGAAFGEHRSYYLLTSDGKESNLYTPNAENPAAGLVQKTFSSTAKSNLSYDELSGTLAYEAAAGAGSAGTIVVWTEETNEERSLGAGTNPTALRGGFFVVYQRGGELLIVNLETNESRVLLTIPEGTSYAVDGQGVRMVMYKPDTSAFQYFSLEDGMLADLPSPKETVAGEVPMLLGLSDATLIQALPMGNEIVSFRVGNGNPAALSLPAAYAKARMTLLNNL